MNNIDPTAPMTERGAIASEPLARYESESRLNREVAHREGNGHTASEVTIDEMVALRAEQESLQESREAVSEASGAAAKAGVVIPPILLPKRSVSGRYQADSGLWRLELRVDVDGQHPLSRISGDYMQISGGTMNYFGSFVVNALSLAVTSTTVTITGTADTTWVTSYNKLKVTIPRVSIFSPAAPATLQWFNAANSPGAAYTCASASGYMRSVELEQDHETGITPFTSYNTGSLPSGGTARLLSLAKAYAEAGVEIATAGVSNVINTAPGGTWSNSELHNAMVTHFSLWREVPQWKVWLLHASLYDDPGVLGIMFDQQGKQRQGCAVFYKHPMMNGSAPNNLRNQLYCCVHELGHCFNLFHSFHKQFMTPPMPSRPGALSWMNYPQFYTPSGGGPSGEAAFWTAFPFQFDDLELIHMRHDFRNNVIMGGNPFGTGAALSAVTDFDDPIVDRSGLKLELRTDRAFELGEPVVVEFKLSAPGGGQQAVHCHLHPDATFVRLAIQKPGGAVVIHEPIMEQCVALETVKINAERPAIYDSAYIGYDKSGLIFDRPGIYRIRALYAALDGSRIVSNTLQVKVRQPVTREDVDVADLLMGEEQGQLFYLLGSDSQHLASGNASLKEVETKYAAHPLSQYARLVSGFNLARTFKTVAADNTVTVRKPQPKEAASLLGSLMDTAKKGLGLDNITLGQAMCRLARTQKVAGDQEAADSTIKGMTAHFKSKGLKPQVLAAIAKQGAAALTAKL